MAVTGSFCRAWARIGVGLMLFAFAVPAAGQGDAEPAKPTERTEPVVFDLQRFLFDADRDRVSDPVWQVRPEDGRRIVLLPLLIQPVSAETELSRSPVSLRGGRFIGFMIPKADPQDRPDSNSQRIDPERLQDQSPGALQRLLFGETPEEDAESKTSEEPGDNAGGDAASDAEPSSSEPAVQGGDPAGEAGEAGETEQDAEPLDPRYQADPPRLARELTLYPDASIGWGLDRAFPSAELESGSERNLYPFKLDAQMLREKEPPRPERIARRDGESSRDYSERKRAAMTEQREKVEAFRSLRNALRDLPDTFREPAPALIYAVFEVEEGDRVVLQGPPPMPWTLTQLQRDMLVEVAGARGSFDDRQRDAVLALKQWSAKREALTDRAVAYALQRGGAAGLVKDNSPGYQLLAGLVASEDPAARRITIFGIANARPQTRNCARLLEAASLSATGQDAAALKLASLRTLLAIDLKNPNNAGELSTAVMQALAEPSGPAASKVIEALLAALSRVAQETDEETYQRIAVAMVDRVGFGKVPDDQLDALISLIASRAPQHNVAAGWLDLKLLRAADAAIADRTLKLLSDAELSTADAAEPEPVALAGKKLVLPQPIAIDSVNHGLVRALEDADADRRDLAWRVLPLFRVKPVEAERPGEPAENTVLDKVLEAALAMDKTPATLLGFINSHRGGGADVWASAASLRLLTAPGVDPAVAKQSGQDLLSAKSDNAGRVLLGMEPQAQRKAIEAFYSQLTGEVPLVIGLMDSENDAITRWFAGQIAQGQLPDAMAWGEQAGGEEGLLRLAASEDAAVASAAAAALVVRVGGSTQDQAGFASALGRLAERNQEAVAQAWAKLKTDLYARALAKAQGAYTLVVTLGGQEQATPAKRVELGVVQLKAEGSSVSLSVQAVGVSVSSEQLAIRIDSLSSLRTLDNPALKDLPLSQLDRPLDLLPREGGVWSGTTELPDGQPLTVSMEPADP